MKNLKWIEIQPFTESYVIFEYTDPNEETSIGFCAPGGISIDSGNGKGTSDQIVKKLFIKAAWLLRFRDAVDVHSHGQTKTKQPVNGSFVRNKPMVFDNPRLVEKGETITIISDRESMRLQVVKHLAELALRLLDDYP